MHSRMQFELQLHQGQLDDQFVADLFKLSVHVFESIEMEYLRWRITNMPDVSLFYALKGNIPVGFKAGYAITESRYYSWLGGVHPDFHRNGIASLLMKEQHSWLRDSEYAIVETHVRQDNAAMIKLNLKFGFTITGNFTKSGDPNHIMQLQVNA